MLPSPNPDPHQQVLPERPECRLASVNLVVVAEPTRSTSVLPCPNPNPHQQVLPERLECRLAIVNLVVVAEPTLHVGAAKP